MPKQNTNPADYPQAVLQQIELLGQNIAIARKRRGETQTQWARRLGVSQPTMARIERGDPSVAMASYVMCMWLVNSAVAVADLISPPNDHAALEREVFRARKPRKRPLKNMANQSSAALSERKEPQELVARSAANSVEEISKSSALGSCDEIERLKKSLPQEAIADGLAALMRKGPSGAK